MVSAITGSIAQPQDTRLCHRLRLPCEIGAVVSRVTAAVSHFFKTAVHFLAENLFKLGERIIQSIPWPLTLLDHRIGVIQTLAAIPENERKNVRGYALQLITPEMRGHDRSRVVTSIARIPVDQRRDVIAHVLRFTLPDETAGYGSPIPEIVTAVATISANQRADVIEHVLQLIPPAPRNIHCVNSFFVSGLIAAIAAVPANQRTDVIRHVLQLITPETNNYARRKIVTVIAAIPADQRNNVVADALRLITPAMHDQDRFMMIQNAAARVVPGFVINAERPAIPHQGINVHEGQRDPRTKAAIQLLYRNQGPIPEAHINQANAEFVRYLDASPMDAAQKKLAKEALLKPQEIGETFGPLIDAAGGKFSILGWELFGKELLGRIWIFTSQLTEPNQRLAKEDMISALRDSYDPLIGRVCNQGKAQRLVAAVLSGRLEGVNIEEGMPIQIATPQAMTMFFHIPAHRAINTLNNLLAAANQFCNENPGVNRTAFILEIRAYAQQAESR